MVVKTLAAMMLAGALIAGERAFQADTSTEHLQARAAAFYSTLQAGRFEQTWAFFNAAFRRDNPIEGYASSLRAAQKAIERSGPLKVSVEKAGDRPIGRVVAAVKITGIDGGLVQAEHVTVWGWGRVSRETEADWYITREEMRRPGAPINGR